MTKEKLSGTALSDLFGGKEKRKPKKIPGAKKKVTPKKKEQGSATAKSNGVASTASAKKKTVKAARANQSSAPKAKAKQNGASHPSQLKKLEVISQESEIVMAIAPENGASRPHISEETHTNNQSSSPMAISDQIEVVSAMESLAPIQEQPYSELSLEEPIHSYSSQEVQQMAPHTPSTSPTDEEIMKQSSTMTEAPVHPTPQPAVIPDTAQNPTPPPVSQSPAEQFAQAPQTQPIASVVVPLVPNNQQVYPRPAAAPHYPQQPTHHYPPVQPVAPQPQPHAPNTPQYPMGFHGYPQNQFVGGAAMPPQPVMPQQTQTPVPMHQHQAPQSQAPQIRLTPPQKRALLARTRQFGLVAPSALLNVMESLCVVWRHTTEERLTSKELFITGATLSLESKLQELRSYGVPEEQLQPIQQQLLQLKAALS